MHCPGRYNRASRRNPSPSGLPDPSTTTAFRIHAAFFDTPYPNVQLRPPRRNTDCFGNSDRDRRSFADVRWPLHRTNIASGRTIGLAMEQQNPGPAATTLRRMPHGISQRRGRQSR